MPHLAHLDWSLEHLINNFSTINTLSYYAFSVNHVSYLLHLTVYTHNDWRIADAQ